MLGDSQLVKHVLLVVTSLLLTYVLASITLMIRWMSFWSRGAYFVSYQAIFLITLTIFLLWWLHRHHTGALPASSTILYSIVVGYVSGLMAMTPYPTSQPDGLQQVAMSLRFPTPEAVAAFLWFPVRMLAWLFGGITGMVMFAISRRNEAPRSKLRGITELNFADFSEAEANPVASYGEYSSSSRS